MKANIVHRHEPTEFHPVDQHPRMAQFAQSKRVDRTIREQTLLEPIASVAVGTQRPHGHV